MATVRAQRTRAFAAHHHHPRARAVTATAANAATKARRWSNARTSRRPAVNRPLIALSRSATSRALGRRAGVLSRHAAMSASSAGQNVFPGRTDRRRRLREDAGDRVAAERPTTGEHFVQHGAEREDVRAIADRPPLRLFRRHIGDRADDDTELRRRRSRHRVCGRIRGRQHFREAEVEHLGLTAIGDHDVGWFDVAMDDSRGMGDRERVGNLLGELDRALQGQAGPGNHLVERTAAHELHDEEVDPVGVIHFVDRDDVRVVERRCGPGLPEKAVAAIAIASRVGGNHLDGHNTAQTRVGRPIDDTHAALADAVFDLVVREGRPDHGRRVVAMGELRASGRDPQHSAQLTNRPRNCRWPRPNRWPVSSRAGALLLYIPPVYLQPLDWLVAAVAS